MKISETQVQFSCESQYEYFRNEFRRAKGKFFSYLINRYQWKYYPRKKVPAFPLNLDIEVSSKCQLECTHCFRQYMDIRENEFMDFEFYRNIVRECARHKLFTLKFSMRGEPLLHPNIIEMVKFAKEEGIREVWINTNGVLLDEKTCLGIIKSGVDWITVSFDGLGKFYESIRKPLKFEESLNKIKLLRRIRDQLKANTLINVQTIWSAISQNPDEYLSVMKKIVDRVAYNLDMNFKEITITPDENFICPRLWQRICITSSGNYLKCPSDFEMEEVLGNFRDYSIKEAWDILQERERQMHLEGRKNESIVCRKCHHGAKKKEVTVIISGQKRKDFVCDSMDNEK